VTEKKSFASMVQSGELSRQASKSRAAKDAYKVLKRSGLTRKQRRAMARKIAKDVRRRLTGGDTKQA
jgi:hypothetical protein